MPLFGGFEVAPGKSVPINVPPGFAFHLSGASMGVDARPKDRCLLCIEREKEHRGESKGSFPIACLSSPRFETTFLDLYIAHGESVSLRNGGGCTVHVIGALVENSPEDGSDDDELDEGPSAIPLAQDVTVVEEEADDSEEEEAQYWASEREGESAYTGLVLPVHRPIHVPDKEARARNSAWNEIAVAAANAQANSNAASGNRHHGNHRRNDNQGKKARGRGGAVGGAGRAKRRK